MSKENHEKLEFMIRLKGEIKEFFEEVKNNSGIDSNSEVARHIFKQYKTTLETEDIIKRIEILEIELKKLKNKK